MPRLSLQAAWMSTLLMAAPVPLMATLTCPKADAVLGSILSSTKVLLGSGDQEPSLFGLTFPAEAVRQVKYNALDLLIGVDEMGRDLKIGTRLRDGLHRQIKCTHSSGERTPELVSGDD